ncbi:MAG: hypothetical protein LBI01_00050 [Elusimicrobium sp.]|jgi:spore photoproduct lyase|nr:hypothetical protein [Elusimicrobium sp.]
MVKEIENYVRVLLPQIGAGKTREIIRLVFEIAKRDKLTPEHILPAAENLNFISAKKLLLKKRYPKNYASAPTDVYYLPELNLDFCSPADYAKKEFYPKYIFVDAQAKDSPLAARVRHMFPAAEYKILDKKQKVGSADYSRRADTLYITRENFDFLKNCPCTAGAAGCGYNLINLGFGCAYECAYCFLQQYQNAHAVALPANLGDFLARVDGAHFNKGPFARPRLGSGEFTDSLLFDHITNYSSEIIEFFRGRPHIDFEFKTKSVNVANILAAEPCGNIVVGWSVNTPRVIAGAEYLTPPLDERLRAAARVAARGFGVAFHFDPVIIYYGWRADYKETILKIAAAVPADAVRWISVGTLRFNRELKKIIEARHRNTEILNEELLVGFDGKLRYSDAQRKEVYSYIFPMLKKYFPKAHVYICMEK